MVGVNFMAMICFGMVSTNKSKLVCAREVHNSN